MATNRTGRKPRVLFVCLGNAVRSQMAEAIARHSAGNMATYASAGLTPLGALAPLTQRVLAERGITCEGHHSKSLEQANHTAADIIINMSGEPRGNYFQGCKAEFEDWRVEDPYGAEIEAYRRSCDVIEIRLAEFTARLRAKHAAAAKPNGAGSAQRRPGS